MESELQLFLIEPDPWTIMGCSAGEAAFIKQTIVLWQEQKESRSTFQVFCLNSSQVSWVRGATEEIVEKLGPERFYVDLVESNQDRICDIGFLSIGSSGLTGVCDYELDPKLIDVSISHSRLKTYVLASPFFVEQAAGNRNPRQESRRKWEALVKTALTWNQN